MLFKSIPAHMMNAAIRHNANSFQLLYQKDMINVFVIELYNVFDTKTHWTEHYKENLLNRC